MSLTDYKITPSMKQYLNIKSQYQEYLLLYQIGDFYELFFEDAIKSHKYLNVVLTKKGQHQGKDIPMCGIPIHSADAYLYKLINAGFKVAICNQLETPEEARKNGNKSIVKRDVVRIITPGTVFEDTLLDSKDHNYLAAIVKHNEIYALAWIELSTNMFYYTSTTINSISSHVLRISPKEILISDQLLEVETIRSIFNNNKISLTKHAASFFESNRSYKILCDFYNVNTLDGIGALNKAEVAACGALIEYIKITQKGNVPKLEYPKLFAQQNFMSLDQSAIKNLELFYTQSGEKNGSLFSIIDKTETALGARLLHQYLSSPFFCHNTINLKLNMVEFFINNTELREKIRYILRDISDIERILSRIIIGRGSPKDMYLLYRTLDKTLKLSHLIFDLDNLGIKTLYNNLGEHTDLVNLLSNTLLENNITNIKDGNFINPESDAKLKELYYLQNHSNILLSKLREEYRKLTGIPNLKILHNNVIGYYIEVSSQHIINIDSFIHKQSLANSVRYVTSELKELEHKIITAREMSINLEIKIFDELRAKISEKSEDIALAAQAIAELDVVTALAELAVTNNYVKPIVDDSLEFNIIEGRHPVVEKKGMFIANDVNLSPNQQIALITGPNMAGKSTFLRQNAIIAILAHIGSFVPAKYAHIGVIDKIFSRVGASDNIAVGYSTFMVEMIETATIINNATPRSLVIVDEIGRGTSTEDGLSIAWATIEHIHNVSKSRSIFATHYHKLSQMSKYLQHLKCFCMDVKEWEDKVIFLHKVIPGNSNKSYGIHVAKLAGFPESVLNRANQLLAEFRDDELIVEE